MLIDRVKELETDWKDIIIEWISKNQELWNRMENYYLEQVERYRDMLSIFPDEENIFRCFSYFDCADTKVVVLGQDPYHGPNQATGLCFGVNNDVKKAKPVLKVKYLKTYKNVNVSI